MPEQDPPWQKQKRESKPSLPVQDPPWFEQKKSGKDRFNKPYPLFTEIARSQHCSYTETAPTVSSERRFDEPYPFNQTTQLANRGKWWEKVANFSPPPLLPRCTSSKRDTFESEKSVSSAPGVSQKPFTPPTSKKSPREADDEFDFPTADQFKAKTNQFSQPALVPRRNSSLYEYRWNDSSTDNRPPPTPPQPPTVIKVWPKGDQVYCILNV